MTSEEQDALVGRTLRELKTAEQELSQLLVKFEQHAADITKLSEELTKRVKRAKLAGQPTDANGRLMAGVQTGYTAQDGGIEHIRNYAKTVDLEAIDALDREIGQAVGKVLTLRQQKKSLNL